MGTKGSVVTVDLGKGQKAKIIIPPEPEHEHELGYRVRISPFLGPQIEIVKITKYTDKTVWIWESMREYKHGRRTLDQYFFLQSEAQEMYKFATLRIEQYIQKRQNQLREARALLTRLDELKARGFKLKTNKAKK